MTTKSYLKSRDCDVFIELKVTLSAKSSLILGENKAAFRRKSYSFFITKFFYHKIVKG